MSETITIVHGSPVTVTPPAVQHVTVETPPAASDVTFEVFKIAQGPQGEAGPIGPASTPMVESFIPTRGQTRFQLGATPVPLSVLVSINGSLLDLGVDVTTDGDQIVLLPALGYQLDAGDRVQARYFLPETVS